MQHGICPLSILPVRLFAEDASEMLTQLLYGDHFKILEQRKKWSKIRIAFDDPEEWIGNQRFSTISGEDFKEIEAGKKIKFSTDLVSFVSIDNSVLLPIVLGCSVLNTELLSHQFEGNYYAGLTKPPLWIENPCLSVLWRRF